MTCEYVHSSDCNQSFIFKSIMSIAQSNVSSKKKAVLTNSVIANILQNTDKCIAKPPR